MQELAALRLYFPLSAKARHTRFWHRLAAPNLAQHLLSYARRMGVMQATLQHIDMGYLPGQKTSHHTIEGTPPRHPQCLELIDVEHKLRKFLHDHEHELHKVHAVLFKCEMPLKS